MQILPAGSSSNRPAGVNSRLFVLDANLEADRHQTAGWRRSVRYRRAVSLQLVRYGLRQQQQSVVEPCRDTPITGNTNPATCSPATTGAGASPATGALAFLGTNTNNFLKGGVKAIFGEVQLPIFDTLNVQGALRYEDYGGQVGSTINPQVRARWQVTDWARGAWRLRHHVPRADAGEYHTGVRDLAAAHRIGVQAGGRLWQRRADAWKIAELSGGVLLKFGGFNASVDYFRYNLKNLIVTDPLSAMVATLFPTGAANTCAANAALAAQFHLHGRRLHRGHDGRQYRPCPHSLAEQCDAEKRRHRRQRQLPLDRIPRIGNAVRNRGRRHAHAAQPGSATSSSRARAFRPPMTESAAQLPVDAVSRAENGRARPMSTWAAGRSMRASR